MVVMVIIYLHIRLRPDSEDDDLLLATKKITQLGKLKWFYSIS